MVRVSKTCVIACSPLSPSEGPSGLLFAKKAIQTCYKLSMPCNGVKVGCVR